MASFGSSGDLPSLWDREDGDLPFELGCPATSHEPFPARNRRPRGVGDAGGRVRTLPPERFPNGVPTPGALPEAVWINKPKECGCARKSDLVDGTQANEFEGPTRDAIPESGRIRSEKAEMLLVGAH